MALREMIALEPEVLLPGHGFPVVGAGRVRQALTDTAELLESLVDQTIELMNTGARLDEILHTVTAPAHLAERPYLRPVYDEPEFVVRNVWRLYGGWWDGNPARRSSRHPRPLWRGSWPPWPAARAPWPSAPWRWSGSAPDAGDPAVSMRLAGHLAELAALAAPSDAAVHRARAEVFARLSETATSTMAKGVFTWTARESERHVGTARLRPRAPTTTRGSPLASVVAVSRRAAETSSTDASRWRRRALGVVAATALPVILGGCQLPTFYGYRGSTKQGHDEFLLWVGTTIAAIVVGVLVAALIVWSIVGVPQEVRRDPPPVPVPHPPRDHLHHRPGHHGADPVRVHRLHREPGGRREPHPGREDPHHGVPVGLAATSTRATSPSTGVTTEDPDPIGYPGALCAPSVDCLGPGLVIPAGQTTRITLNSQDVIHGFYVPQFNFSRYAQPGITNVFDLTPFAAGVYRAQCTQLCGLYHSLMFFHVVALPPHQFQAWLKSQQSLARADATVDLVHLVHQGGRMTLLADRPVAHEHEHEHHEGPVGPAEVAHEHRPQADRHELHGHVARHVLPGGPHGVGVADAAGDARQLVPQLPAVQRAVHDARQPDAVPLRRPLRLRRAGQLHPAAAGRRARHGVPPAQRPVVLAVPHRLDHDAARVPRRRGGRRLRVGRLRPAVVGAVLTRLGAGPVDPRDRPHRVLGHLHRRQPGHDHRSTCAPRG